MAVTVTILLMINRWWPYLNNNCTNIADTDPDIGDANISNDVYAGDGIETVCFKDAALG